MTPELESDPLRKMPATPAPKIKADIGSLLLAARLKRGLTIESASKQTRISKKYLEALESNRFEDFPAMVYLRGFLKNYCDFLEEDFEPLWRTILEETAPKPAPQPERAQPAASPPPPVQPPPRPELDSRPAGTGAILFAALLAGLLLFWVRNSSHSSKEAPSAAESPALSQPAEQSRILLAFRRDAWLSVSVDGEPRFEGRVPRGQTQEWRPRSFLLLRTTDPQSLRLLINGNPSPLPAPDASSGYRIESP